MKIKHPAVVSDVFKLISTLEFDLEFGGHFLPARAELFQDTERKRHFRSRLWERELCHITLSLAQGKKIRPESDEEILVERTWELSDEFEDFKAANPRQAMKRFLDSISAYLQKVVQANEPKCPPPPGKPKTARKTTGNKPKKR